MMFLIVALVLTLIMVINGNVVANNPERRLVTVMQQNRGRLDPDSGRDTIKYYTRGVYTVLFDDDETVLRGALPAEFTADVPLQGGTVRRVDCGEMAFFVSDERVDTPEGGAWLRSVIDTEPTGGGFMTTIITTYDNKRVILPNSDITKNRIVNFSAEKTRRVDLKYSISYADDIAKAKDVVMQTALRNEMVLKKPLPEVYVGAHSSSSIELFCRVWCDTPNYWAVFFAMQENVKLAFDENGIQIPFTQVDVHLVDHKE